MPKLEIYDDKTVLEKDEPVLLKLFKSTDNSVLLVAVNRYGNMLPAGRLLKIHSDGSISRIRSIDGGLGFRLGSYGQLLDKG